MALPIVPFIYGAFVGSITTYLYKDETSKQKIKTSLQNISNKIQSYVKKDTSKEDNSSAAT